MQHYKTTRFSSKKQFLMVVFLVFAGWFLATQTAAVFAGTLSVDVNDGSCITGTSGTPYAVVYCNIQDAINDSVNGDTIEIAAGTYVESLDVNKELILSGAGTAAVEINASSFNDYSIDVTADNVTLEGFTLIGNPTHASAYGIKIASSAPTRLANATVQDVIVDNSRRTGIDLNGVDVALIKDVEVKNVVSGNGLAITDSNDIVFENITTSNNAWGGLAIYTYGRYYSLGSDNVTIQGTNSFGEANKVYVERGNYYNPGSPEPVTNLTVNGFAYTVMNDTFRAGAPNFTFYQITRSDAIDFAIDLSTPEDSYVNQISNGHFWVGQNGSGSMTIEAAVDHAPDGSTINVLDGTYVEDGQVLVDTDITLIGAGKNDTIVKTNADTGTSGDSRAWFLVDANTSFDVSDLTFDGDGYKIYQAIRNKGEGSADNVKFVNIQYNASGPNYQGVAIAAFGTGPVDVTNSHFSEIGRIGVLYFGSGVNGSEFKNNTYVGKGAGDWLDYALDISNGAEVIVMGNDISNNKGVASSDGSNSAGILVSTFFGPGTTATITENDLYNNSSAIAVGYDGSDTSTVVANYNNITGNDNGIYSTAALVDGTRNWWGDASGPSGAGPGTGDSVDAETSYCPWLDDEFASGSASGGAAAQNTDTSEYFCSIQAAIDDSDTDAGDTIEVFAGTFNEQVEIDKNDLTLIGQGPSDTKLVSDVACTNTMNSSATAGVRLLGDHSGITLEGFSVSGYDLGLDIGENIGKTISDVTVKNVHANNNCVHGILSQAGNTDGVLVENVTANDNGSGFFAGRGLWFINGTKADITIKDSSFNDNRLVGIDISDGDVTGLSITGNTVTGNGDSGIGVLGPQGPDNNLVDDNTVTDNGRYGIEIKNPSGTTTVSNNTVSLTGPGSDTRDYAGIAVFRRGPGTTNADQPSGVTVTGNTVTGFAEPNGDGEGFGIVVEGTGMSVTENTVSNNDVGIQVQEGNPSPNTNGTDYFDRGDASVAATVVINNNNITGNTAGVRAVGTTNVTDGTINWWGDISGPSGEGTGSGDSVSANVTFCPWLDAAFPGGSPTTASGGFATTSTDGHTTKYCTIEEAMFASSGANQEVHVEEGNWPGEVMNRDYTDSPNLVVKAIGDREDTVIDGINLTSAGFDGLKFTNFTITGDAPTPSGYDPGYAVEITNNGNYKNLAFVGNIFDGENVEDAAAIFSNRGWDGFLLDDNQFINFNDSPLTPLVDPYFANYSLVFMEAQVFTPAGRGNNYVATNNVFDGITHSNALEAFRWQNVTMTGNEVTGTFGRLLVWSYAEDPLLNVNISDNEIEITAGNDIATSTGIGVYYADADVNITGNKVTGANTCINTTGVTDLELTGNTLTNCAARGHYFSDSDLYVAPVSAVIENNVFDTSPAGVENAAQTFELNACHNIFIDITTKRFENPGPFVDCGALTITKFDDKNMNGVQDNGESALSGWTFDIYADDLLVTSETTDSNGQIVLEDFEYNDYEVCEQQKDGWKNTTDLCQDVTVAEDVPGSLSFGNFRMKLSPVLECVYTPQGSLTSYALYGYNNVDTDPVNQPIGGDNKFTPAPQDQGQPTEFATGRQVGVFWVPFTSANLVWTLKHPESGLGGTATAGLGLNTCGDRLPTGTITIAKEVHDVPETPALDFEFSGDLGAFSLAAGQSTTFEAVPIGSYDVKELVPANWGLGEINCEGGSTSEINNGVNIVLDVNDEVSCTFNNAPTCDDPAADLSAYINSDGDKAWVTNNSTAFCSWDVGMASYEKYDDVIDNQVLFDYVDGVNVDPGETVKLEVDLPECAVQVDVFYGPHLESLDGQRYGKRLLAYRHMPGNGYCELTPDGNSITGYVIAGNEGLPGVNVTVTQLEGDGLVLHTVTNVDGFYGFEGIPYGSYRVELSGDVLDTIILNSTFDVVEVSADGPGIANFESTNTPTAVTVSALQTNTTSSSQMTLLLTVVLLLSFTFVTLWRRQTD